MIAAKGLVKSFKGFQALKGLDMHVKAGEVYGFIGQNGAGKTTTLNILAGLARPDRGECAVNGKDVRRLAHGWADAATVTDDLVSRCHGGQRATDAMWQNFCCHASLSVLLGPRKAFFRVV